MIKQQREKCTIPISNLKCETTTYRIRKLTAITVYKDNGLFFAENEGLFLFGYGPSGVRPLQLHHLKQVSSSINKSEVYAYPVRLSLVPVFAAHFTPGYSHNYSGDTKLEVVQEIVYNIKETLPKDDSYT
ncbi:MAG TPA: hypothetical protein ENI23_01005 [bacterium]|nr:hypothetical protein [bacterium]